MIVPFSRFRGVGAGVTMRTGGVGASPQIRHGVVCYKFLTRNVDGL